MCARGLRRGGSRELKALIAIIIAIVGYFVYQSRPRALDGEVVKVLDGDTVEVMSEGKPQKVRLQGVDCPERKQAFGDRAKRFTSDAAFGKVVQVRTHGKDGYGRVLGEVILPDGRNLNQELVAAGMAWWYRQYSKDATLSRLESEARSARRGLWQDKSPVAPWDFRKDSSDDRP